MEVGTNLRSLRAEAGLSTVQVADRLHISESTYRKYETDKSSPTLDVMSEIAGIYGKTLIEILPSQLMQTDNRLLLLELYTKIEDQIAGLTNQMNDLIRQNEELRGTQRISILKMVKSNQ